MTKNIGSIDRIARFVLAALLILGGTLKFPAMEGDMIGIVMLVFAGVMLLTGSLSFCPLYTIVKFSTKKD